VNPHFAAMLGYTVKEMLGTEFMPYSTPEERGRIVDFYSRRARGETVPPRYETAMVHKNGGHVYAEVSAGIIPYGGQQATFVFLRDITEEVQAKRALEEAYQVLEQRVEERTKELATLNAIASVASRSLDLKEIMNAALDKTLETMNMEFGAAYGLEGNKEQPPEVAAAKLQPLTAVRPEAVAQVMRAAQATPRQTKEPDLLRLLAYRGVSAGFAESVGDLRLPGAAAALARVGEPFEWPVKDTVPAGTHLGQFLEREGQDIPIGAISGNDQRIEEEGLLSLTAQRISLSQEHLECIGGSQQVVIHEPQPIEARLRGPFHALVESAGAAGILRHANVADRTARRRGSCRLDRSGVAAVCRRDQISAAQILVRAVGGVIVDDIKCVEGMALPEQGVQTLTEQVFPVVRHDDSRNLLFGLRHARSSQEPTGPRRRSPPLPRRSSPVSLSGKPASW